MEVSILTLEGTKHFSPFILYLYVNNVEKNGTVAATNEFFDADTTTNCIKFLTFIRIYHGI